MRGKKIIAAIGALFIGGAAEAADITARYVMPSIGNAIMTVQADDRGNSRISVDGETALIIRDGVSYVIAADSESAFTLPGEPLTRADFAARLNRSLTRRD